MKPYISILLLFLSHNASALWVKMEDCELIDNSDLIIHAVYEETQTEIDDPKTINLGSLIVKHLYKGNDTDEKILIKQPDHRQPRKSTDIIFSRDQRGIWFLKRDDTENYYIINSPQRFLTWSEKRHDFVNSLLQKCS